MFVDILAGNDVSEFNSVISKYLYGFFTVCLNMSKTRYFDFRRDNTNSESHLIVHHSETAESVDCCNSLGTVTVSKLQTL